MKKLSYYVLTNGEGTYITKNKSENKYVQIRSLSKAERFPTLSKALSVLNNSIAKSIRSHYLPERHEDSGQVNKSDMEKQNEICFRAIEDSNIESWAENIKQIDTLFGGAENRYSELSSKLSDIDKQVVDVEHYIEFGKFNCYQGWVCFKMLQNLLQQRRQYKNEMEVLQKIKDCKIAPTDIHKLSTSIEDIQNKIYRPRAFPELFKGA